MKRLLACALVAVIGNASAAFAGESLLTSGTRQIQQIAAAPAAASASAAAKSALPTAIAGQSGSPSFQTDAGPGNLSKSSHSKMTKVLMYTAIGAGFAISAWQIDKHVLNITPSSLGQRKD